MGLFGIFNDSLPDGWGHLLMDRMLSKNSINPSSLTPLDRLAIVGKSGMGALEYSPQEKLKMKKGSSLDLDYISNQCSQILDDKKSDNLDYLFEMGGSSGGARPKIFKEINNEEWIIKFPSAMDTKDIGLQEYLYCQCAKNCGIEIPEINLFESKKCEGYFGIKRFDRLGNNKIHMASASALLNTSHRYPNLDYTQLLKLTKYITKSEEEVNKMFKLMCFNVFSHNRDDHSKNFTFIYNNGWKLSPAYDLTYSNSINGEHATTIAGEGANPSINDILKVADAIGISKRKAKNTAENIQEIVMQQLSKYLKN
jgi:serine/threonine-protein kinase HipA